ncbi:unnamed protein product [Urochloa humidicola]
MAGNEERSRMKLGMCGRSGQGRFNFGGEDGEYWAGELPMLGSVRSARGRREKRGRWKVRASCREDKGWGWRPCSDGRARTTNSGKDRQAVAGTGEETLAAASAAWQVADKVSFVFD